MSGDRVEFLNRFSERLKKSGCIASEHAALGYADAIDEELAFKARRRAIEERAGALARERSVAARERLRERIELAGDSLPEVSQIIRDSLVLEADFLVEDARGAIADILKHCYESSELSQQLMAQLERQVKDPNASVAFREAMHRRFSLTHERQLSYKGMDSTTLFEIYSSLLLFEEKVPELEDVEGKLQLRRDASAALNGERGILKGLLYSKKTGWLEDISTGEVAAKLTSTIDALRARAEGSNKIKAQAELADAHFRVGAFAALREKVDEALTHMREVVRLSLNDELVEMMDKGHLPRKINAGQFRKANKYFRANEESIRRCKAAGNYIELFARRAERDLDAGRRPEIEPDQLDKIMDTLETERVLGERAPNYKILRYLPRIETVGKKEYRIRDFLQPGAGGQAGQMALLRHVFGDEPFNQFMGYKVVETEREDGTVGRYMTKVGINEYVRREYLKVFPRLFPNFESEMVRQRNGIPNQVFTARFATELAGWLKRKSKDDVQHIRTFAAEVLEIVHKDKRFPLMMLEFVPGLSDDLPKTIYSHQADSEGNISVREQSMIACEKAKNAIRDQIMDRVVREIGLQRERIHYEFIAKLLSRVRAHTAALATLLMNVDHQVFTVDGAMIAMDYEILFAPCFDPDWSAPVEPGAPVSTYFTKRVNVSWVSDRDELDDYFAVADLYSAFVKEKSDVLMDWGMEAGFLLSEAGSVKDLLVRNAERLARDVETLSRCGGTVYLTSPRTEWRKTAASSTARSSHGTSSAAVARTRWRSSCRGRPAPPRITSAARRGASTWGRPERSPR